MKVDPKYEEVSGRRPGCLYCGAPIAAASRTDKKFCCPACRASYHNHQKYRSSRCRTMTVKAIETNYSILCDLLKLDISQLPLSEILSLGFNPHFITGQLREKGGFVNFCYDIRYRISDTRIFNIERIVLNLRDNGRYK